MTNKSRNSKPNPYESLPTLPTLSLTSGDVREGAAPPLDQRSAGVGDKDGMHRDFVVVRALEGTPAYPAFVVLNPTLARATLVATAETRGGRS